MSALSPCVPQVETCSGAQTWSLCAILHIGSNEIVRRYPKKPDPHSQVLRRLRLLCFEQVASSTGMQHALSPVLLWRRRFLAPHQNPNFQNASHKGQGCSPEPLPSLSSPGFRLCHLPLTLLFIHSRCCGRGRDPVRASAIHVCYQQPPSLQRPPFRDPRSAILGLPNYRVYCGAVGWTFAKTWRRCACLTILYCSSVLFASPVRMPHSRLPRVGGRPSVSIVIASVPHTTLVSLSGYLTSR